MLNFNFSGSYMSDTKTHHQQSFKLTIWTPYILFDLDSVEIKAILDKKTMVTKPADYLNTVTIIVAMFWVFDVQFPPELKRTLTFLAGRHVCQLMPVKPSPIIQKVIDVMYS
jgi:hypothetical protein